MNAFKKIIGDRVYLSPQGGASEEEIEKFAEWLNDFKVTDYLNGASSKVYTVAGEKEYFENTNMHTVNRHFNIIALDADKLIGTVGLENFDWISRSATLGIFIGDKDYRDKGYGTEAINLILEYGFKYLNLHSIKLNVLSINDRAHKCYSKCGFKNAGYSREDKFINGKYYGTLHMDILESEFSGDYIRNKNI